MISINKQFVLCFIGIFGINGVLSNCMLSMKLDLTNNQPVVLSSVTGDFYPLDATPTGTLQLSRDETVKLACPNTPKNSFQAFPTETSITAKCKSGSTFAVKGKDYNFDQLQCASSVQPTTQKTGKSCAKPNTELIKVGFAYDHSFATVYEVCFDKETRGTLYTEVEISPNIVKNDAPVRETQYVNDASLYGTNDLDTKYTCDQQAETFKAISGKEFIPPTHKCCYARAQLVNAKDLAYGTQQYAVYHYLNTVPQWNTCNRENWIEVENRIRTLAANLQRPLKVWSGTFRHIVARSKWVLFSYDLYMNYNNKNDKSVPVPLYIWKVIHDPKTRKSLAVITVNKPSLTQAEIESYVLCPDICHNVNWMNFMRRQTIGSGYTYCCDLNDFAFAFQFNKGPFPEAAGAILRDETKTTW